MKNRYLLMILLLQACSVPAGQPKTSQAPSAKPTVVVNKKLHVRMLEDVPVEDRKYLLVDTSVAIPGASRKVTARGSLFREHKPDKLPNEESVYYFVAGSFESHDEAQLLVNYFETEGLEATILPFQNLKRVVIKLKSDEATARKRLDELNEKYEGIIEFWFLQD